MSTLSTKTNCLGKNIPHDSARGHVTGESIFIDDRPFLKGELWVSYLGSPVAAGVVRSIDAAPARAIPGVAGVFTASDLFHNRWGTIFADQPILVDQQIGYRDEPLCVIAANSPAALLEAKKSIQLVIEETRPLFTIDEAIEKKQFIYRASPLLVGEPDIMIKNAPHRLKGVFECGGQEHFYMESQAAIVYPLENGALEVHSSSQHPTETQQVVAHTLGLPLHQVVCVVKRMGGAFGGKESQAAPIAAMAALVAHKLRKPARIVLTKDEDMQVTGKRHPFKNFYEIGFDSEGRILGLKVQLYSNGGAYADLSSSVLERAMFHIDGAYYLPHAQIEGTVCRTNMHSNTAFRGFGGPQGTMTIEGILEDMAVYLGKDAFELRRLNCYGKADRNITHYGQVVENNLLPELFERLHRSSNYAARLQDIKTGNEKTENEKTGNKKTGNEFRKPRRGLAPNPLRGISMTAVKFGIAFTAKFLNQGSAQVNVYRDGTIQVSTGATEMGQGVNVKIQQTVAFAFSVPCENVQVMTTSTEKNHNTSPTAASAGADINCAAALKACGAIQKRLRWLAYLYFQGAQPNGVQAEGQDLNRMEGLYEAAVLSTGPEIEKALSLIQFKESTVIQSLTGQQIAFEDLLTLAYRSRISLGEYAHYKTEGIGFDFENQSERGKPFKYFTNGVAVSEVEIDEYTGQLKVVRVDILMDLGRTMNPGIDRGQVTGAFIQGQGWVTTEVLFYGNQGQLLSHSPTTYKIPNIQDTPRIFNVELFENDGNQGNAIFGTKAVGEPPLLLCASVWTAVKHALSFRNRGQLAAIKSPVTAEEILLTLNE